MLGIAEALSLCLQAVREQNACPDQGLRLDSSYLQQLSQCGIKPLNSNFRFENLNAEIVAGVLKPLSLSYHSE